MITGASASGKTTLGNMALNNGWRCASVHLTRPKRPDEIEGVHGVFLTEEQFVANFAQGAYIETSLQDTLLQPIGYYYGTPKSMLYDLRQDGVCAIPTCVKMARKVFEIIDEVVWVHLICSDVDRRARLVARNITGDEIEARMTMGESSDSPPGDATIYSTSDLSADDILRDIRANCVSA